jgi:hypothetical protein
MSVNSRKVFYFIFYRDYKSLAAIISEKMNSPDFQGALTKMRAEKGLKKKPMAGSPTALRVMRAERHRELQKQMVDNRKYKIDVKQFPSDVAVNDIKPKKGKKSNYPKCNIDLTQKPEFLKEYSVYNSRHEFNVPEPGAPLEIGKEKEVDAVLGRVDALLNRKRPREHKKEQDPTQSWLGLQPHSGVDFDVFKKFDDYDNYAKVLQNNLSANKKGTGDYEEF